jgi:hypothetical protein
VDNATIRAFAPKAVLELGVPVLDICYGEQTLCAQLGDRVEIGTHREFGRAFIDITGRRPVRGRAGANRRRVRSRWRYGAAEEAAMTERPALTCHACGGTPATWRSKTTKPWDRTNMDRRPIADPSDPAPVLFAGLQMFQFSTADPLCPCLSERCCRELWAVHDLLGKR